MTSVSMTQVISEKTQVWLPIATFIGLMVTIAGAFYWVGGFTTKVDSLVISISELKADVKDIKVSQITEDKVRTIIAESNEKKN